MVSNNNLLATCCGYVVIVWGCGVDCDVLDQRENTACPQPLKGVQYGNKSTLFTLILSISCMKSMTISYSCHVIIYLNGVCIRAKYNVQQ